MPTPTAPLLRKPSSLRMVQRAYSSTSPGPAAESLGDQNEPAMRSPSVASSHSELDAKPSIYSYCSESPGSDDESSGDLRTRSMRSAAVEPRSPELDAKPSGHPVFPAASSALNKADPTSSEVDLTSVMYDGEMLPRQAVDGLKALEEISKQVGMMQTTSDSHVKEMALSKEIDDAIENRRQIDRKFRDGKVPTGPRSHS